MRIVQLCEAVGTPPRTVRHDHHPVTDMRVDDPTGPLALKCRAWPLSTLFERDPRVVNVSRETIGEWMP